MARSFYNCIHILLVCALLWDMFALAGNYIILMMVVRMINCINLNLGVHHFKGRFYSCVSTDTEERLPIEEVSNRTACDALQANSSATWTNAEINFDNVSSAFLALASHSHKIFKNLCR